MTGEELPLRGQIAEGSVMVRDLLSAQKGEFPEVLSRSSLQPGRYRVTVPLAALPHTSPVVSELQVTISAAGTKRTLGLESLGVDRLHKPVSMEFGVTVSKPCRILVTWQLGEASWKHVLSTQPVPIAPAAADITDNDGDDDLDGFEPEDLSGWVNLDRAAELSTRLVMGLPSIQKLTPVAIQSIETEKIHYPPGEQTRVKVGLRNYSSGETLRGRLVISRQYGLNTLTRIGAKEVVLAPKSVTTIEVPFTVDDALFGHEVLAEMIVAGAVATARSVAFSVSEPENFWDVALGGINNGIFHSTGRYGDRTEAIIVESIARMRRNYSNWFERDFWAPDDWGNLTPERDWWISGQAARWEHKKNMKRLNDEGHKFGIKAITYGKGMAGGPSGYQLLRERPELFMRSPKTGRWGGNPDLWDFHHWNDRDHPGKNYHQYSSNWHRLAPDLSKEEALDYGIRELIESTRMFGWDGVRFDGHFTAVDDALSTYNMRRTKEKIWEVFPDYLFGFNNTSTFARVNPREDREAMAGGSQWMQEGIGWFQFKNSLPYVEWKHFAESEQTASRRLQEMGGTYHYIYRLRESPNDVVRYYKFVIGTLNAAHPDYGGHTETPGCESWGKFLTRWSELFWHPNSTALDLDKQKIQAHGISDAVLWKLWAKSVPVSPQAELLVFPFLVLPDAPVISETNAYPAPMSGGKLDFSQSACRSRIKTVSWLTTGSLRPRTLKLRDGVVSLPQLDRLGILIAELDGCPDYRAIDRPRFTEPVPPQEVAKSRASGKQIVTVDPLRPELNVLPDDGTEIQESERHSWSMNLMTFNDPDASAGRAAGADKSFPKPYCIGAYFNGIQPGAYRVTIRAKVSAALKGGFHRNIYENIPLGKGQYKAREGTPRSQRWGPIKFSDMGLEPDRFGTFVVLDRYEHYGLGFLTVFLQGSLKNEPTDDARFLLDWVKIEQLETYTDHDIARKLELEDQSTVAVGERRKVLWVRGLYDDLYRIDKAAERAFAKPDLTRAYQRRGLPMTAAELATYGTVIMPNVPVSGDVSSLHLKARKACVDWVKAGGHLVLLGGSVGLGQGGMQGGFFEDILPCEILQQADISKLPEGAMVKNANGAEIGSIHYAHTTKVKDVAQVYATTGALPLMMTIPAGKGRCTVFAGTVLGAKAKAPDAFWNSAGWVKLLGDAIKNGN